MRIPFDLRRVVLTLAVSFSLLGSHPPAAAADTPSLAAGWTRLTSPQEPVLVGGGKTRGTLVVAAAWTDPCLVYAGGQSGLFSSHDCGRTWEFVPVQSRSGTPYGIPAEAVATDRAGRLYVQGLVSSDGGRTWVFGVPARPELYHNAHGVDSWAIASSPAQDGLVYAELHSEQCEGACGTGRSLDAGLTWEVLHCGKRFYHFMPYVADPLDPDVLYGASGRVWRSTDGGSCFEPFAPEFPDLVRGLAMSPDGSRFWLSRSTGELFRSLDRGETWERVADTPYQGYLVSLSAGPFDPHLVFGVTDSGEVWAYREPAPLDFPIPNGHFYTQANGQGGEGGTGFAVTDEGGIPFYSTLQSLPLQSIGYPISQRFTYRGFTTQLFQKLALQWQPGRGVFFMNLFDDLHAAGQDPWLQAYRSTPPPEDTSPDAGLSWEQVLARHLAILDQDPTLRDAYLSQLRWLDLYGLPTGYADYPNVSVVRGQRAALQRWKADFPWARAGEITVANAGEIAREGGLFPAEALQPQPPPAPDQ